MKKIQKTIFIALILRLSGNISEMAGKLGGSVFYRGRTGLTMRNMRHGKNPNTINQTDRRSQFSSASGNWRSILSSKQLAWIAAAKLFPRKNKVGAVIYGSGSSLYGSVNDYAAYINFCRVLSGAVAPITLPIVDPPSFAPPVNGGDIATFAAENVGGVQAMVIDKPLVTAGDVLYVEATPQLSPGIHNPKGKFRPIMAFGAAAAAPATDILSEYQAQFGDLVGGKKIFIRAYYYNLTGQSPVRYSAGAMLSAVVAIV